MWPPWEDFSRNVFLDSMTPKKITDQFRTMFDVARQMAATLGADALLVLVDSPLDWQSVQQLATEQKVVIAADTADELDGAAASGLATVILNMADSPVYEKLAQALLEAVADEVLETGASVVALYSGFEAETIDSVSLIHLDEHLGRLTARDLRQLETRVPLDTLKTVVDLAIEIGREGREGKPVGTMFVVGDTRKVMELSHPMGFDPVKGYGRKERNLGDPRVREQVKEIAQLDGAFVVGADGTVEASARYIDASAEKLLLPKGLGSRHWSAAAITRATKAVAVVVSESNGSVRLFHNGDIVLRVEPLRRPMKWKDFEFEPPNAE
jgi:DNA integrity scanning protein DisA with diadenylate cyclase activity